MVETALGLRPQEAGASLAGATGGLVAYVVGSDVHVLRLNEGRRTTIRTPSRALVLRQLAEAEIGL